MPTQLITYDLISPGKDYTELHNAIKALGDWWHYLESTWIIDTDSTSVEIRNALGSHIDGNDKLLVVKLEGHWASQHLSTAGSDWLKQHVGG